MNTYTIQEKDLGIVGIANSFNAIVRPYIIGSNDVVLDVHYRYNGDIVYTKQLTVPEEVVAEWGTDDMVIIDFVCTELGLTLV